MRNLTITALSTVLLVWSTTGCVSQAGTARSATDPRVDEVAQKQERLSLRMDELVLRLLDIQARLDRAEDIAARPARREEPRLEAGTLQLSGAVAPAAQPVPVVRAAQPVPVVVLRPEPVKRAMPTPQAAGKSVKAAMDAATRAYQETYTLYRKGEYAKAILDFEGFVGQYPNHEYADDAQFWIGESYFSQNVYEQAIVEFNRVIGNYPQGKRAPNAHLMIGDSYERLGQPDKARAAYKRLIAQYPASDAAHMAKKRINNP